MGRFAQERGLQSLENRLNGRTNFTTLWCTHIKWTTLKQKWCYKEYYSYLNFQFSILKHLYTSCSRRYETAEKVILTAILTQDILPAVQMLINHNIKHAKDTFACCIYFFTMKHLTKQQTMKIWKLKITNKNRLLILVSFKAVIHIVLRNKLLSSSIQALWRIFAIKLCLGNKVKSSNFEANFVPFPEFSQKYAPHRKRF